MKRIKNLLTAIMLSMFMGVMISCSGKPSPDDVMSKINSHEQLETADYETMLDYLEEFIELGEENPYDYEAGQEASKQYPYFMTFIVNLDNAPSEVKSSEQYKDVTRRFSRLINP